MKGIIFRSFLAFTRQEFGEVFVEDMFSLVPSGTEGAYSNVGTYPSSELLQMMGHVLEHYEGDAAELQSAFGEFTFARLASRYPDLVNQYEDAFQCVYDVDRTIHQNVRKLYPEAELPNMNARLQNNGQQLLLDYQSPRAFMHMAHGLLKGCLQHYGDSARLSMDDLSGGAGTHARFTLTRDD